MVIKQLKVDKLTTKTKNINILCVQQKKETHTGLEQNEWGVSDIRIFIFG